MKKILKYSWAIFCVLAVLVLAVIFNKQKAEEVDIRNKNQKTKSELIERYNPLLASDYDFIKKEDMQTKFPIQQPIFFDGYVSDIFSVSGDSYVKILAPPNSLVLKCTREILKNINTIESVFIVAKIEKIDDDQVFESAFELSGECIDIKTKLGDDSFDEAYQDK